ncbi:MAG: ankyrin repeat domain-containing protein [Flavobacteriales bacterium]|nr:ankyrin repeat domain-containing protein [Flavobacteriales bacterium]
MQLLLQHAVRHGRLELLKMYISAGLPTHVTDENGYDLVHTTIFEDHAEVLAYLLGIGLRPGPLPEHDDRELKEVVRSKRVRRMLADIDRPT